MLHRAYINIGTNLGDKEQNIEQAIGFLEHRLGLKCRRSHLIKSHPWGYSSENDFLNIGVSVDTSIEPLELLHLLKGIERDMHSESHRNSTGGYADRLIDLDIMDIDGVKIESEQLSIPHPHLWERDFFYIPYKELLETSTN